MLPDYMYGAAAYNLWESVHEGMQAYYEGNTQVLLPQESPKHSASDAPSGEESNSRDRSYTAPRRRKRGEVIRQGKIDLLDRMNLGLMKAFRIAPEEVAGKYQRQRDEAYGELREREASRKKVLEWIGNASILEFLDRVISYIPTVSSNTLV